MSLGGGAVPQVGFQGVENEPQLVRPVLSSSRPRPAVSRLAVCCLAFGETLPALCRPVVTPGVLPDTCGQGRLPRTVFDTCFDSGSRRMPGCTSQPLAGLTPGPCPKGNQPQRGSNEGSGRSSALHSWHSLGRLADYCWAKALLVVPSGLTPADHATCCPA